MSGGFPPLQLRREDAVVDGVCAVLMTLHAADRLDLFELALASVEGQRGLSCPPRIYLCCDGPLGPERDDWLRWNWHRFHKIVQNGRNLGLAASLNRLIGELADEDLVFRMDGDDLSEPDRFRKQADHLARNPGLGLIGCQAVDIDEAGRDCGPRRYPVQPEAVDAALCRLNPVLHPAWCLRRSVLRDPAARYPQAYLSEDLAFLVVLRGIGIGIGNHPETLLRWRIGPGFFARRRSARRGWAEMIWYGRAIRQRHGLLTPRQAYALARFALRLAPPRLMRRIYGSGLRARAAALGHE